MNEDRMRLKRYAEATVGSPDFQVAIENATKAHAAYMRALGTLAAMSARATPYEIDSNTKVKMALEFVDIHLKELRQKLEEILESHREELFD